MNRNAIALTVGVDEEARRFVRAQLTAFNSEMSEEMRRVYALGEETPAPLAVFAREQSGAVVGGVYGGMRWGWLNVDVLWVSAGHRGAGLGTRLLAAIEKEARQGGGMAATLDTMDYQARGFYEKQGYVLYGELKNFPRAHTKYFLVKRFV